MLSRTSNDVDTPFDTASPPSDELVTQLSQPVTLRPVSYVVEDGATQPSIRLKTVQEAQRGRRSGWRWPALVWSAVALTAFVARVPIAQSFGSLGSLGAQGGPRPAAAGGGLDSAASPGSVPVTRAPRVFSRDNVWNEQAPEKSALPPETKAPTPRPTATATATATGDAKPKAKPKREKARPATGAAASTPDEMAAAAATLAQAKSEETLR